MASLREAERSATNLGTLSSLTVKAFWSVSVDELLGGEVIDTDAIFGTNNNPEDTGSEDDAVDWRFSITLIKMLSINKVPYVNLTVSATGGEESSSTGDIEAVDLSLVANESVHQGHGGVVPNLDSSIPRSRDDNRSLQVIIVSDAGNPVGMSVLLNSEFTNTMDVPNLKVFIDGSRSDLSVIGRERNREDIFGVTNESLSGFTSLEVPKTDGRVPGRGEAETGVLRDINVGDEVRVASENSSRKTSFSLVITVSNVLEIPDDERSISGTRDKELTVGAIRKSFLSGFDAVNPAVVALKESSVG